MPKGICIEVFPLKCNLINSKLSLRLNEFAGHLFEAKIIECIIRKNSFCTSILFYFIVKEQEGQFQFLERN